MLAAGALMLGLFAVVSQETQAAPPAPANFTVAAGQTATVRVNVFCLDYNKDFPAGQNIVPGAAAADNLRNALAYGVDKGYDQSNPRQLQLALWYLRDNTFHTNAGENKTIAQEVVDNVGKAPTVAAGTGTALADAVKNGQATVTATGVQALTQGEFYGTAVLEVKNTGTASLNLSLAPGTVFTAPAGTNFQSLIAYPTGAQGTTPAQATTAPATTAVATTAVATTAAPTTAVATTAVATTAVATTAPATTVAPTATTVVAALPSTGAGGSNGSDGSPVGLALVLAMLAMLAGTGVMILKRHNS